MEIIINRNVLLEELYQKVISRENVQIFGNEGVGKTYLTKQLIGKLHQRRICFCFSFRGIRRVQDFAYYYQQVLQKVAQDFPTVAYHLRQFFNNFSVQQIRDWEQWLVWHNSLTKALVKLSQDLLFVLDHLDEWEIEGSEGFPAEAIKQLNLAPNCQWLFVQKHKTERKNFSALHVSSILLQEVEYEEAKEAEAAALLDFAKGNAKFLIELLELEGTLQERKESLIKSVHPRFHFFKTRFTPLQWNVLRAIALEENVDQPMAFEFLMKYRLGAASSIDRALTNLMYSSMVYKSKSGYTLTNPIMLRWFQWLYSAN